MNREYDSVVDKLYNIPRGAKTDLEHTRELLKALDVDLKGNNIIHVAGTNGKGSVCSYIGSVLREEGFTTGVFSSPHLVKINERISIDGIDISDDDFVDIYYKVEEAVTALLKEGFAPPTFFEYMLVMAMLAFKEAQVDYIILETGLGGRLDQTNVFTEPLATVITHIGIDHTEFLGDTIESIAYEKAGIIKQNVPLIFCDIEQNVSTIMKEVANRHCAPVYAVSLVEGELKDGKITFVYDAYEYELNTVAKYQIMNASLAISFLANVLHIDKDVIKVGLSNAFWKGRMQQIRPNVYIDGGHNVDGIEAFIETLKDMKGTKALLFSMVADKDYEHVIELICKAKLFETIVLTKMNNYRALEVSVMKSVFEKYTDVPIFVENDVKTAFKKWTSSRKEDILFCVGSLYLVGEIMEEDI